MTTVSPDSMVRTGFDAALKFPMFTVCGLGISTYSAACAPKTPALHTVAAQATKCVSPRAIGMVLLSRLAMTRSSRLPEGVDLFAC
jgi:hypothetical protein